MAPKPKQAPWNSFTKAELIRTIKTLSARETKHLNRIAALERGRNAVAATLHNDAECVHVQSAFPWEQS